MSKPLKKMLLLLVLLAAGTLCAQTAEVLARVGSEEITEDEFRQRYELSLWTTVNPRGIEEGLKKEFLHTLIAEKLFTQAARGQRLDTIPAVKYTLQEFRRKLLRDALYYEEIKNKVNPSEDMISLEAQKIGKRLLVQYIATPDPVEANNLKHMFDGGVPFATVFSELPQERRDAQTMEVTFGVLEKDAEDIVFALDEGGVSAPVQNDGKYFLFHVAGRRDTLQASARNFENIWNEAKSVTENRLEQQALQQFRAEFFKGLKVDTSAPLLRILVERFRELFLKKAAEGDVLQTGGHYLSSRDVLAVEARIAPDSLAMTYIQLPDKKISLGDFLRHYLIDEFTVDDYEPKTIEQQLRRHTKQFIEHELLADEAERRGLQSTPRVREKMNTWTDYILAQAYENQFIDSAVVTEEEIIDQYNRRRERAANSTYVHVLEVLTESPAASEEALKALDEGIPFRDVAKEFSTREGAPENGGDLGMQPAANLGIIGQTASQLQQGEVYGPFQTAEGFHIIKLVEKRKGTPEDAGDFAALRDKIRRDLAFNKVNDSLINATVQLARRYGFSINEPMLKSIRVNHIYTLIYQHLGFGGRIPAVPLIKGYDEWIEAYNTSLGITP